MHTWSNNGHRDAMRVLGSYQAGQMQSHTHYDSEHSHGGSNARSHSHNGSISSTGNHRHSRSTSEGGKHSHEGRTNSDGRHYHRLRRRNKDIFGSYKGVNQANTQNIDNDGGPIQYAGSHTHKFETDSASSHFHSISNNNARAHSHPLTINSAGPHSHSLSISTSRASLGKPTASGAGAVRHGSETRPQNVALLFCIKH